MNDFYKIISVEQVENNWLFEIEINSKHRIFEGHFPNQPIVPGVCTLQIIRECVENILCKEVCFTQISSCKFVSVVNPLLGNRVNLNISLTETHNENISIQADGQFIDSDFIKLKACLKTA